MCEGDSKRLVGPLSLVRCQDWRSLLPAVSKVAMGLRLEVARYKPPANDDSPYKVGNQRATYERLLEQAREHDRQRRK